MKKPAFKLKKGEKLPTDFATRVGEVEEILSAYQMYGGVGGEGDKGNMMPSLERTLFSRDWKDLLKVTDLSSGDVGLVPWMHGMIVYKKLVIDAFITTKKIRRRYDDMIEDMVSVLVSRNRGGRTEYVDMSKTQILLHNLNEMAKPKVK